MYQCHVSCSYTSQSEMIILSSIHLSVEISLPTCWKQCDVLSLDLNPHVLCTVSFESFMQGTAHDGKFLPPGIVTNIHSIQQTSCIQKITVVSSVIAYNMYPYCFAKIFIQINVDYFEVRTLTCFPWISICQIQASMTSFEEDLFIIRSLDDHLILVPFHTHTFPQDS